MDFRAKGHAAQFNKIENLVPQRTALTLLLAISFHAGCASGRTSQVAPLASTAPDAARVAGYRQSPHSSSDLGKLLAVDKDARGIPAMTAAWSDVPRQSQDRATEIDPEGISAMAAIDGNNPGVVSEARTTATEADNPLHEIGVVDQPLNAGAEGRTPVEALVQMALASHPKILAARQRVAAASHVIPQASALPDPAFNNVFWPLHDNALQTAGGRMANQMSLNQMVPFPDKLATKATIANREVQIAQAEVDRIAREIKESVQLAYYELWFAGRAMQIVEENKALVTDLTQVAEARFRSGGSQQDVLRAQLETDRLDEQLITLRRQQEVAAADLATLLQQPGTFFPVPTDSLNVIDIPQQLDALIAQAEQCNPQLRGLAWEIQRDRDRQRLACLQQYPDFMVGLNWGLISDSHNVVSPVANGNDNLSMSFGTTLPIWRDKIHAGIREAAHRTDSTARRYEAERDELAGKLRRLLAQTDALVEQRMLYEERIVPRTEDTLQLSIADYRGKRADFYVLIETYRELLMFETQLARIEATLAGTIAQIERTVGCRVDLAQQ